MLYSIDRTTPEERLRKVEQEELDRISEWFRNRGVPVQSRF